MVYRTLLLSLVIFTAMPVQAADSSKKEDSFFVKNWKKIKKAKKGTILLTAALGVVVVKMMVNHANKKWAQEQERLKYFGLFDEAAGRSLVQQLEKFDEPNKRRIIEQLTQINEEGNREVCAVCVQAIGTCGIPRILRCTHTFCEPCLRNWYITQLATVEDHKTRIEKGERIERPLTCPGCPHCRAPFKL